MGTPNITKLSKAKVGLLTRRPFFGTLVLGTEHVESYDIPTAATDMKRIIYNPDFMNELSTAHIEFVLAHEVMHIALNHGFRRGDRNPMLWNMACDYVINWLLQQDGFEVLAGVLIDRQYADMPTEQVYDLLIKDCKAQPQQGDGNEQGEAGQGGQNPQPGQGKGPAQGGSLGGDILEPDVSGPAEAKDQAARNTGKVVQAATAARMAGKLPAGVARHIDELLNPRMPWQDLLRDYMLKTVQTNENWSRRNKRFRQVYLPTRSAPSMGILSVMGDTSGSITPVEVNFIASEVQGIVDNLLPETVYMVWGDTKVACVQEFEPGEALEFTPAGYGGTDMRVLIDYVEDHQDPDVAILITDGYTPWPTVAPSYPLIICCTTDVAVPAHLGQIVRVEL